MLNKLNWALEKAEMASFTWGLRLLVLFLFMCAHTEFIPIRTDLQCDARQAEVLSSGMKVDLRQ